MRTLSEYDSKRLLADYGLPVCREILATDLEMAHEAANEIGYPVVVKGCAPGLAHKTERGLVEMGVGDADQLDAAAARMLQEVSQVLVQETVTGGRELMLGMKRDPQFGPCVSFGLGGVLSEALDDVALGLVPISEAEAQAMLDAIRAKEVLGPYRGMEPVDRDVLVRAIIGLGRAALEHPEIVEIDVNPLIVSEGRPVAVDALVVLKS